jgi:dolichol-phosphate mannosyltransferase
MTLRVSILIAVFQEEAYIAETLRRVLACSVDRAGFESEVLVCDDGSTDGTSAAIAAVAESARALRVFRHPTNKGKGAAIRTLLDHVTGDCVLVQDADHEYEVEDAIGLLRAFADGHRAVFGSRFLERPWPSGMRPINYVANRVLTTTANVLYRHRLTDEATCLKLIDTSLLRAMRLECDRFEFCPEVTAKLGIMNVPIHEVPVRYRARRHIDGKKIGWRDGFHALETLLRHRIGWSP